MFIDYYSILDIDENSTQETIKSAFKKQAFKWHPDRNSGTDTTFRMQGLNEAYLILKDNDARKRYDIEYQIFKKYKQKEPQRIIKKDQYEYTNQKQSNQNEKKYEYTEYKVNDDILKKWIENAKRQAVNLAKQTIEDLTGMIAVGTKTAIKETSSYFVFHILVSAVLFVLFTIVKSCRN
jgi:curved DNA-binding protein CbpA